MIVHQLGTDTRTVFEWLDTLGADVPIDEATVTVLDRTGDPVADVITLVTTDVVAAHIADTVEIDPGNYLYDIKARSGTDWHQLSAGLLRIR